MLRKFPYLPLHRLKLLAVAWDLTATTPDLLPPRDVVLRPAESADFPRLLSFMQRPDFQGERVPLLSGIEQRYEEGDVCFIGEYRGEIAYISWMRFDSASLGKFGIEISLVSGEAYVGTAMTLPEFRGRGLATAAETARARWLRDKGIGQTYAWVHPSNFVMLKVMRRTDARPVGHIVQFFMKVSRQTRRILNLAASFHPDDPLASWCSPPRLHFTSGISVYRRGRIEWPGGHGASQSPLSAPQPPGSSRQMRM